MGVVLFAVSLILTSLFFVVSLVFNPIYYLVSLKWKTGLKELDRYFRRLAISIDQFGNGATSIILNKVLLIRTERHIQNYHITEDNFSQNDIFSLPFGDMDLTISYVIGVNKYLNNLTRTGKLIERLLNLLEKFHVEKALDNQYHSDRKSKKRLKKPFAYYHR